MVSYFTAHGQRRPEIYYTPALAGSLEAVVPHVDTRFIVARIAARKAVAAIARIIGALIGCPTFTRGIAVPANTVTKVTKDDQMYSLTVGFILFQ